MHYVTVSAHAILHQQLQNLLAWLLSWYPLDFKCFSYMSQTRWYTSWYLWPTLPSCQLRKATQWFSYHDIRGQMKSKATATMKCSTSHCGRWCPCTQEPSNFLMLRLYIRLLNGGHNKKLHSCNTCTKDQFHFSISPCRLGAEMDTMSIGLMGFCWGNWVLNKMHGDWRHQADRPVHIHSTINHNHYKLTWCMSCMKVCAATIKSAMTTSYLVNNATNKINSIRTRVGTTLPCIDDSVLR